ncbi:MAG: exo-alpha-sialidase [Actinobacteria bacterium]|nr:MAG: exo-alpha-sialidase [Actinomycetota bacterium]
MRTLLVTLAAALVLAVPAGAGDIVGFTEQVSPRADENATEPYIAIDRSDGTIYVAWQSGGSHVARSDDGGRTFTTVFDQHDVGDVDVAVGGPTPCTLPSNGCVPGTRRVYLTSIEETPLPLQTHLAYSDDRGATWTVNELAALNPSAIDRPWLAVYPGSVATSDKVYIGYHDFTISQIWVAASIDGGQTFGPSEDTFSDVHAQSETFCNSIPSGLEVDPNTGEVYIQWITAGPIQNAQGCDLTQNQNFHEVWIAHSAGAGVAPVTTWDDHLVFDGPEDTNADKIFADIAVDSAGNVYSVFPDNLAAPDHFDIWFSHSSDKAASWSAPVKVNSDKVTHFFPWIAAGSAGRVDFIWLNSPDYTPTDAELSPWYVTFAQTTNGTAMEPKFNQTSESSSVMHVGGICTNGIFCSLSGGNRDLADSISIAIDRGGSAGLVWTDQGRVLHGPTHISYGCNTSQQSALAGANQRLSCKGPAGP